jgi:hypothetical protein
MTPAEKVKIVQDLVSKGRSKIAASVFDLSGGIARLKQQMDVLTPQSGKWAAEGMAAADGGYNPLMGWPAWDALGKTYADGYAYAIDGSNVYWPALTQVLEELPAAIPKNLADAAKGTSKVMGEAAGNIIAPVAKALSPMLIVVAVVALVGAGAYYFIVVKK